MPSAQQLPSQRWRAVAWDSANHLYEPVKNEDPGSRGTFASKSAALTAARGRELEMDAACEHHGVTVERNRPQITFATYAAKWLQIVADEDGIPKNTVKSYDVCVRALTEHFGPTRLLRDITGEHVDHLLAAMRKGPKPLSPSTRRTRLSVLRKIMQFAVAADSLRDTDPTIGRKVKVPRRSMSRARILDEYELANVLGFLPAWFRPGALLAFDCGLRESEVAGLLWGDVDLRVPTSATVYVIGMMDRDRVRRDGTKGNDESAPGIPIRPRTAKALVELREAYPGEDDEHVFRIPKKSGPALLRPQYIATMWRTARERAGLDVPDKPNVRFHDLRHACATNLAAQGHPAWVIRDALRHRDINTSQAYVGLTPDRQLREAMTGVRHLRVVGE